MVKRVRIDEGFLIKWKDKIMDYKDGYIQADHELSKFLEWLEYYD